MTLGTGTTEMAKLILVLSGSQELTSSNAAHELIKPVTSDLFLHQWHRQSASQMIQNRPLQVTLSSCKDRNYDLAEIPLGSWIHLSRKKLSVAET